jgi:hypothetical protein
LSFANIHDGIAPSECNRRARADDIPSSRACETDDELFRHAVLLAIARVRHAADYFQRIGVPVDR